MKHAILAACALVMFTASVHAATPHNDDGCDIALLPAATLLLPYFEVDLDSASGAGPTTLVSITNVSHVEQVANVTLWTDRAYPVLSFNVYLTGYDVQSINLYDVLAQGRIAPPHGTGFERRGSPDGEFSRDNPLLDRSHCSDIPAVLPASTLARVREAFLSGRTSDCATAGYQHPHAIGYATIDVIGSCTTSHPGDPLYFDEVARFDNVLTGEYFQVDRRRNAAQGFSLVHIRAIPEGDTGAARASFPEAFRSDFPRTFYGRLLQRGRISDARQPLPSTFAVRWLSGGPAEFRTDVTIWRDGVANPDTYCSNDHLEFRFWFNEVVVFDEEENAVGNAFDIGDCAPVCIPNLLPATGRHDFDRGPFPTFDNAEIGGWMYLNLGNPFESFGVTQNWVTVTLRENGRLAADLDAVPLGNGCSPEAPISVVDRRGIGVIGPAPNR